jgi:hypothetical protein
MNRLTHCPYLMLNTVREVRVFVRAVQAAGLVVEPQYLVNLDAQTGLWYYYGHVDETWPTIYYWGGTLPLPSALTTVRRVGIPSNSIDHFVACARRLSALTGAHPS